LLPETTSLPSGLRATDRTQPLDIEEDTVLILNHQEVEALLDLDRLIRALEPAMVDLSAGRVSMPPRVTAEVGDQHGFLLSMPVYLPSPATLCTKLVSLFPHNAGTGVPTHQAVSVVFDAASGSPAALLDATHITAMRTAAGSALATRLLARPEADVLVIVGTGVQARAHAQAIPRVRPVREIRVVGRHPSKARALADEITRQQGIATTAGTSFSDAAAGAGIVCATTHSPTPVVFGTWLEPGTHVNSVGVNPQGGELDTDTVAQSLIVVESRQAVLAPPPSGASDLVRRIQNGTITEAHIHAEVGELLSGAREGRTLADQITLYKSVGVAVQDAVAARLVLDAARQRGVGTEVAV
jgi:alanine dehydrogenase